MVSHISVSRSTALGTYQAVYKWSLISGLMSSAPTVHREAQYEEIFTLERRNPKSGPMSVSLFPFLLKRNDASNGYLTVPSVGLWWVKAHREIGTVSDIEQAFMKCHITVLSITINELIVRLYSELVKTKSPEPICLSWDARSISNFVPVGKLLNL